MELYSLSPAMACSASFELLKLTSNMVSVRPSGNHASTLDTFLYILASADSGSSNGHVNCTCGQGMYVR